MIDLIKIKNFKSHLDSSISLDQFNIMVGASSSGKTSVIHAILWLFTGDWDATWPTDDTKPSAIMVQKNDGTAVMRVRVGKKNRARYFRNGKWEDWMKDFGDIVPGIHEFINVRPVVVGKKRVSLNFTDQDEPVFMLKESRPVKAQMLGRLYGAHAVNNMLRAMASDKKNLDATDKRLTENLVPIEQRLRGFPDLDGSRDELQLAYSVFKEAETLGVLSDETRALRASQQALEPRRWLVATDFEPAKKALARLGRLKDLKKDATVVAAREQIVLQDRWMVNEDFNALKILVEKLRTLRQLYRYSDKNIGISILIEKKRAILDTNFESLKEDLRQLKDMMLLSLTSMTNGMRQDQLADKMKLANKNLKKLKQDLKKGMFKDGKCPVCASKPKKMTADTLAKNLRQLTGATA